MCNVRFLFSDLECRGLGGGMSIQEAFSAGAACDQEGCSSGGHHSTTWLRSGW